LRNKSNYQSNELKSNWEGSRMKNDQMVTVTQLRRNFVFLEVMWMIRKIISGLPFIPLFSIESVNQKRHLNISESTNYKFTLNK
jgi:hypothetical protein